MSGLLKLCYVTLFYEVLKKKNLPGIKKEIFTVTIECNFFFLMPFKSYTFLLLLMDISGALLSLGVEIYYFKS